MEQKLGIKKEENRKTVLQRLIPLRTVFLFRRYLFDLGLRINTMTRSGVVWAGMLLVEEVYSTSAVFPTKAPEKIWPLGRKVPCAAMPFNWRVPSVLTKLL